MSILPCYRDSIHKRPKAPKYELRNDLIAQHRKKTSSPTSPIIHCTALPLTHAPSLGAKVAVLPLSRIVRQVRSSAPMLLFPKPRISIADAQSCRAMSLVAVLSQDTRTRKLVCHPKIQNANSKLLSLRKSHFAVPKSLIRRTVWCVRCIVYAEELSAKNHEKKCA